MSDFERVDSFFGDAPYEQNDYVISRQTSVELGAVAIYWATMQIDNPDPPETLRAIVVNARRSIYVGHDRYFSGFHRRKFRDLVSIGHGMVGEGLNGQSFVDDRDDGVEFRQSHGVSPDSTLRYMGISPSVPNINSTFEFNTKGQIYLPRNDETMRARFNEVMDFVEAHQTKSADMKA